MCPHGCFVLDRDQGFIHATQTLSTELHFRSCQSGFLLLDNITMKNRKSMNIFLWAVDHPPEYIFFFFAFCKLTYFLPFSCKYYLIHGAYLDHTGRQAITIFKKISTAMTGFTLLGLTESRNASSPFVTFLSTWGWFCSSGRRPRFPLQCISSSVISFVDRSLLHHQDCFPEAG